MICLLATSVTAGQSKPGPVMPEYVIEFHTADGCMFSPISGPNNRGLLTYALARPTNYAPDSAGQPVLSKITTLVEQKGELWNVKVFLGAGEFYDASEQQLAAFTLDTNERVDVGDAARFGLPPFRVGVFKVLGRDSDQPRVTLKTPSIAVEKLEVNPLPEPYRLFLKNNSKKDVLALQYNTYKDERLLHWEWRSLPSPQLIIKAGEVHLFEVLSQDRTCAEAQGYRPLQSNKIQVVSVVFVDGSFEGEPGLAALVRGIALGNRDNLRRVVATLGNLNQAELWKPEDFIYQMKSLAAGIVEGEDPAMIESLRAGLPPEGNYSTSALGNFIRSGQHEIKTSLLADARVLESLMKRGNVDTVNDRCGKILVKYKEWLVIAESVSAH